MLLERREFLHDNIPDDLEFHAKVGMNQLVASSRNIAPRDHRLARFLKVVALAHSGRASARIRALSFG